MAAVSPPLDMLLRLSVCCCGRMSLRLGECQWRADPSVTVSGRPVMNGPGMRREDGMGGGGWVWVQGGGGRVANRGVRSVYVRRRACLFFFFLQRGGLMMN